jgi:hypothetical protein
MLAPGDSLTITSTLTGGYQTSDLQVNFSSSKSFETLSANACTVNSVNNSCSITVTTPMVAPSPSVSISGPITINVSSPSAFVSPESVNINTLSTFNNNWQVVVQGGNYLSSNSAYMITDDSPALMSTDQNGKLYYADNLGRVWMASGNGFTLTYDYSSVAKSPLALAVDSNETIGIGFAVYDSENCQFCTSAGVFYTYDNLTNSSSEHSPWYSPIFPTAVVYNANIQRFYWGDSDGEFHFVSTFNGSHTSYNQDDCDGVISMAAGQAPTSSPQFYAVCANTKYGNFYNINLFSCSTAFFNCSLLDTGSHAATIATDGSGNLYAAWGSSADNIILYPQGSMNNSIHFTTPSDMPETLAGNTTAGCTSGITNGSACALTQVAWDNSNTQLISLYEYDNYMKLIAYNPVTGIKETVVTFPALPEPPYMPGVVSLSDGELSLTLPNTPISTTPLVISGHTIYYMGLSGTIYSLQY